MRACTHTHTRRRKASVYLAPPWLLRSVWRALLHCLSILVPRRCVQLCIPCCVRMAWRCELHLMTWWRCCGCWREGPSGPRCTDIGVCVNGVSEGFYPTGLACKATHQRGFVGLADAFSGDHTRHRLFCSQRRTPEGGLAEALFLLSPPFSSSFSFVHSICVCVCVSESGCKRKVVCKSTSISNVLEVL